jgi:hypothetical protein
MIGPEAELPRDASEDAVSLELSDLRSGACAVLRLARTGNGSRASARALVCAAGEPVAVFDEHDLEPGIDSWESAEAAGLAIDTVQPLSSWRARLVHGAIALDVIAEATSAPIDFEEGLPESLAQAAGIHRYEQLCRVHGTLHVDGAAIEIDGVGRRAHAWGEPAGAGFRSLYAVGESRSVTVAAVRPAGSEGHGAELIAAFLVTPDGPPEPFEDVRLSTVYDSAGRPRTAGLELFMPGDEYPRRVSGEAVCASPARRDDAPAACFRWSFEGEPAQGGYRVARPA